MTVGKPTARGVTAAERLRLQAGPPCRGDLAIVDPPQTVLCSTDFRPMGLPRVAEAREGRNGCRREPVSHGIQSRLLRSRGSHLPAAHASQQPLHKMRGVQILQPLPLGRPACPKLEHCRTGGPTLSTRGLHV